MNKEVENKLLSCKTLSEFFAMFFGLSMKDKLSVFSESIPVTKGTEFYRIRRTEGINDPNDPKEWGPVPTVYARQGRFNKKGESVLYLASTSGFLEREVRLKENEEYYLAKYVCNNSFSVGSFLGTDSLVNMLIHRVAMAVSSENDLTKTEIELLDEYCGQRDVKSMNDLSVDMLASLYIYRHLPRLYDVTSKLSTLLLMENECGIRYSSVFFPIELSGALQIISYDDTKFGNYALTQKGYENIDFVSAEKRTAGSIKELDVLIKEFAKTMNGSV